MHDRERAWRAMMVARAESCRACRLSVTDATCKPTPSHISTILRRRNCLRAPSLQAPTCCRTSLGFSLFFDGSDTDLGELIRHAEDFMSEYSKTFKGEKGEAEAYCYFFREEGNLASLRQVFRVVFRSLHFLAPVRCYCLVGDLVCDMRQR